MNAAAGNAITVSDRYVAVRYIGKKPNKRDTILGRKVEWKGQGDVRWVPEKDALQYIQFADIWELASDVDTPTGGIEGLSQAAAAPPPPPSDLKSTNPLPKALNLSPDPEFASDPKAAAFYADMKQFAKSSVAENLTLDTAMARLTKIMEAIPKLRKDEYGPDGTPKATGIKRVLGGLPVSAIERDIAWHMLKKKLAELHAKVVEETGGGAAPEPEDEGASEPSGPEGAAPSVADEIP